MAQRLPIQEAARIFHQALKAYRESIGEQGLAEWDRTTPENREKGAHFVRLILEHPDITPALHHEAWVAWQTYRGWRRGSAKDPARKLNPSMVPWEDLPRHKQIETELMIAIVRALSPMMRGVARKHRGGGVHMRGVVNIGRLTVAG